MTFFEVCQFGAQIIYLLLRGGAVWDAGPLIGEICLKPADFRFNTGNLLIQIIHAFLALGRLLGCLLIGLIDARLRRQTSQKRIELRIGQ